jgi:hemerythrin-like domain-containing protein
MYTDNLRRQHQEIIAIVTDMQKTIRQSRAIDVTVGDKLRKSLVDLSGRVTVHLATEDQVVYPKMMKHTDPKVSSTAKRFADEMGGIGEVFKGYLSRWRTGVAIANDSSKFVQETQQIASALSSRIEREERELYPMID